MKILFLSLFSVIIGSAVFSQTENELRDQLIKDPIFIKFNKARLFFIIGVIDDKWGNSKLKRTKIDRTKVKNITELKELYQKAGVDSGYFNAYDNVRNAQLMVVKKYAAVVKSNPEMFKKVVKELTSDIIPSKSHLN